MISEEEFREFEKQLKLSLQSLPGAEAQYLMAPVKRQTLQDLLAVNPNPNKSAVLLLITPVENDFAITLTKRTSGRGPHSGQISFPGGKYEDEDVSLINTALREASEEINLKKDETKILGSMTELFIPVSNFLVHPVVATAFPHPELKPNETEVEQIFYLTLSTLQDEKLIKRKKFISTIRGEIEAPYFDIHGFEIWGATAMILSEFKTLINKF
jgi:8-oxo-dGTP pyrophosphatase MutT (NUDIX family)